MLCNVPEGCKAFFLTSDGKSVHALEHEDSHLYSRLCHCEQCNRFSDGWWTTHTSSAVSSSLREGGLVEERSCAWLTIAHQWHLEYLEEENEGSWGMITALEVPPGFQQQWQQMFVLIPVGSSWTSKERLSFVHQAALRGKHSAEVGTEH